MKKSVMQYHFLSKDMSPLLQFQRLMTSVFLHTKNLSLGLKLKKDNILLNSALD